MSETREKLVNFMHDIAQYGYAMSLLLWDMKTGAPKESAAGHIEAVTHLSSITFNMEKSDELKNIIETLSKPEEYDNLEPELKLTVDMYKKDIEKNERIPEEFYKEFVRARAISSNAWEEAKSKGDFSIFAPHLEKMIKMTKEMVGYTDPGKDVYDVLLDEHEEGMTSDKIDEIFEELKAELLPLTKAVLSKEQPDSEKFKGHYDIEQQKKVNQLLIEYMGFNMDAGMIAESEHPFTMGINPMDVRMTNSYTEDEAISAMFSSIHEGGHGIFEQNINKDYMYTRAAGCRFSALHESQSRFYENILGRNINFWLPIYDKITELLPDLKGKSIEEFIREVNHVKTGFIRCDADELTYNFHIILRYELEKAIFKDNINVYDLPKMWADKSEEYLFIRPENDSDGILQDMHWSEGMFGYFPSYLLGTVYDGMFLDAVSRDLGDVDEILKSGQIKKITTWLNENIHKNGSMYLPGDTIKKVCGCELNAKPIIKYFKDKYNKIYNL